MTLFIVIVCHYNDLQIQNWHMLSSLTGAQGGEGEKAFPSLLFAPSHSISTKLYHMEHDKIPAGLRAARSCMAQSWLSAHWSISISSHHFHRNNTMETLLCHPPEVSLCGEAQNTYTLLRSQVNQTSALQESPRANLRLRTVCCRMSVASNGHWCSIPLWILLRAARDVHP